MKSSPAIEGLVAKYRKVVPFIDNDRVMYPLIDASIHFVREEFDTL